MNIARSFSNWRRYRETRHELNRLPHRQLIDIGVFRSDIPTIAKKAVD